MNYELAWLTPEQVVTRNVPDYPGYEWGEAVFEDGTEVRFPYAPAVRSEMGDQFMSMVDELVRQGYDDASRGSAQ